MANVSRQQEVDIVRAWEGNTKSMADLGRTYHMTRQGIYKILLRYGCNTTKRRLEVSCLTCGNLMMRTRKQVRVRKHIFCSVDCYKAWFQAISKYEYSCYGSRVAREKVRLYFDIQEGNIVHHINGKGTDNDLSNLVVYRCQGDHLRAHRGFDAIPIWEGKVIIDEITIVKRPIGRPRKNSLI
jgi:hypothetical protein